MNATYGKTILCLLACFFITNISSFAQDIYPLVVHTQNGDGIAFNKEAITLVDQGISFPTGLAAVNFDGSLLIAGEKVLQIDSANQVSQSKISLDNPEQIRFAWENNLLVYTSQSNNAKIHVVDVKTGIEINALDIQKEELPPGFLCGIGISNDAKNILFLFQFASGPMGLEHVIFDGETFSSPQVLFTYEAISFYDSTTTGDRIVYQAIDQNEEPAFETEMVEGKWTTPSSLVMEDGKFHLVNLSGDGKSLLLKNNDLKLMLSSYENNQWSKPIDLGYQMSGLDRIRVSEDGNTIAIAGARKPTPSFQSDALPVFDLYSLMKNASGKWVLTQLNDTESAVYRGQILLTPSGNKIFWLKQPVSELTGISQPGMY